MLFHRIRFWAAALLMSPLLATAALSSAVAEDCVPSCTDEGCQACSESCGCSLDVHELFNRVAGDDSIFGDLKGRKAGGMTYSVGGELRHRFMNERNRFRPPGPGGRLDYQYSLWRFNPYMQMQFTDRVGGYVEAIEAAAFSEDPNDRNYDPVGIDVNRLDFLRYYGELKLFDEGGKTLKYRYGRQFLKYGGQRLLSPLAWSNTYRNFEGHKLLYSGSDWNVDAFMMKSVNAAAGGSGFNDVGLDSADEDRWISGLYSTWKGIEGADVDLYWLYFNERNDNAARMDGERHTIGTRFAGGQPVKECGKVVGTWAWEFEGAYQFGRDTFGTNSADVSAGMASATVGYTFNSLPWSPGVKGFYYWSSGGDPTSGDINTFYTMYPLGHAYWGLIDNFSGQNLQDAGVTFSAKPHKKLAVAVSYHHFEKSSNADNIYNIVGAAAAGTGSDLGDEWDIVATIPVSKNFNVQLGYFWFFSGSGYSIRPDATQFYAQTTWKF